MSMKQNRNQRARMCRECGEPGSKRAVCSRCSTRKPGRQHRDKYATAITHPNTDERN